MCRTRGPLVLGLGVVAMSLAVGDAAWAQKDPGAARELLKRGAELRKADRCAEAVPQLLESHRLDPQSKTLINLADCEERIGRWTAADKHWVEARDRAGNESNDAIRSEASARLEALERRMPRLVVTLDPKAPSGTIVLRDDVELGAVALGTPLPTDVGTHRIVVRAPGHASTSAEVTCAEGKTTTWLARIGPAVAVAETPVVHEPERPTATTNELGTQRIVAIATLGVGVASLAVGSYFAIRAHGKWDDAQPHCHGTLCDAAGVELAGDAKSAGNLGTVFLAIGGAAAAAGVVLWLTAPRTVGVAPSVGPGGVGATLTARLP